MGTARRRRNIRAAGDDRGFVDSGSGPFDAEIDDLWTGRR